MFLRSGSVSEIEWGSGGVSCVYISFGDFGCRIGKGDGVWVQMGMGRGEGRAVKGTIR